MKRLEMCSHTHSIFNRAFPSFAKTLTTYKIAMHSNVKFPNDLVNFQSHFPPFENCISFNYHLPFAKSICIHQVKPNP